MESSQGSWRIYASLVVKELMDYLRAVEIVLFPFTWQCNLVAKEGPKISYRDTSEEPKLLPELKLERKAFQKQKQCKKSHKGQRTRDKKLTQTQEPDARKNVEVLYDDGK